MSDLYASPRDVLSRRDLSFSSANSERARPLKLGAVFKSGVPLLPSDPVVSAFSDVIATASVGIAGDA